VLADGFYEWHREGSVKIPYYITLASGAPFAFAGLWERPTTTWRRYTIACPLSSSRIERNDGLRAMRHCSKRRRRTARHSARGRWTGESTTHETRART
jgi:putative SOS response-associated peptidase YedK